MKLSKFQIYIYLYIFFLHLLIFLPFSTMDKVENIKILEFRMDYLIHILIFLPWAFLKPKSGVKPWQWLMLGLVFAAGAEFIHYFLPYRSFNINDLIGNVAGIILGWGMRTIWKLINLKIWKLGKFESRRWMYWRSKLVSIYNRDLRDLNIRWFEDWSKISRIKIEKKYEIRNHKNSYFNESSNVQILLIPIKDAAWKCRLKMQTS